MVENFEVAGMKIQIMGDKLPPRNSLQPFACGIGPDEPHACIQEWQPDMRIVMVDEPARNLPEFDYTDRGIHWGDFEDGRRCLCLFHSEIHIISCALVSQDWSDVELYMDTRDAFSGYFIKPILETLFYNLCLFHEGIVLHAAAIEWQGGGLVFSAPSGTGKSTHADMWVRHRGAQYINGDRPLLRMIGGEAFVCGTAWSGSADIYKNICVPIASLVFLEQHQVNNIAALTPVEALKYMLPRCFLPYQDGKMMALAMDNINKIILRTSCWHLQCRADLDAVGLVYQCAMTSPQYNK